MTPSILKAIIDQTHEIDQSAFNPQDFSFLSKGHNTFVLVSEASNFEIEVVAADWHTKSFQMRINDRDYTVQLKDEYDILIDRLGFAKAGSQQVKELTAPMPGLVLEISLEQGQTVEKGQSILILEAMKMENVLKSPGDAVVASIEVEKGQAVEKGQLLIRFE
ncbi:MAG: acetyl-CoA carboxylase biotin carboxyl carrier protein subunit [Bacteroidota bacterium]